MTDSAFPSPETEHMHYVPGLTKREYAAIHIAAALAGRGVMFAGEDVAKRAVELADAVLREAGE
ncbi:hypothetical protein G5V65_11340 [Rhodobacter sp. HX-7-19]|uniref:Uncharacterized protein n=1 Tax=Paragemmobacter kunshanensis TaxID=2583234 RepID=A0A6M1U9X9_9RHOB|nr:hypothetical protein [Rhodobacter kunshanensis]NGQ91491.1 hypothetical protein [Rhodobacter kunshanensis]